MLKRLLKNSETKNLGCFWKGNCGFAGIVLIAPIGLRPFCFLASLRCDQVASYLTESRLASQQNDSQFFIPGFFNSLLTVRRSCPRSSRFLLRPAGFPLRPAGFGGQVAGLATLRTILRQSYEAHEGRLGLKGCKVIWSGDTSQPPQFSGWYIAGVKVIVRSVEILLVQEGALHMKSDFILAAAPSVSHICFAITAPSSP